MDDTETDCAYDQSSDQEANSDFLFPDLNSGSDSDREDWHRMTRQPEYFGPCSVKCARGERKVDHFDH